MKVPTRARHTRLIGLVAAVTLVAAALVASFIPSASAAVSASISIDANQRLATLPSTGAGMNVAVYDENMNGSSIPGLLKNAGVGMVRYPGGSFADIYHWQTNTADGG